MTILDEMHRLVADAHEAYVAAIHTGVQPSINVQRRELLYAYFLLDTATAQHINLGSK